MTDPEADRRRGLEVAARVRAGRAPGGDHDHRRTRPPDRAHPDPDHAPLPLAGAARRGRRGRHRGQRARSGGAAPTRTARARRSASRRRRTRRAPATARCSPRRAGRSTRRGGLEVRRRGPVPTASRPRRSPRTPRTTYRTPTSRTASTSSTRPAARATRSRCSGRRPAVGLLDATDHTVIREPDRATGWSSAATGMDRAAFEALLSHLRLVSLAEFESALPVVVRHRRRPTGGGPEDPRRHRGGLRRDRSGRHHPRHPLRRAGPLPVRRRHRRRSTPAPGSRSSTTPRTPTTRRVPTRPRGCWAPRVSGRC